VIVCPHWVVSEYFAVCEPCPLYTRKRILHSGLTTRRNKFGRSK
jgi:hypothetical protein